jgi:hypothetical protein
MKCTKCGHDNRKGIKFCEECGELLKAPGHVPGNLCPHCGTANRAGIKFCENCGKLLADATPPAASKATRASGTSGAGLKANPYKILFWILIILMVIGSAILVADRLLNDVPFWEARSMSRGVVSALYPELKNVKPNVNAFREGGHGMVSYTYQTQINITLIDGSTTAGTVGVVITVDRKTGEVSIITIQ